MQKFFSANALEEMLINFEPYIDIINIKNKVTVCRDPKDNFLLALSKEGKADYLITGDKDLLVLEKFGNTRIMNFAGFIEVIKL